MMWLVVIILALLLLVLSFVCLRLSRRLLEFDELFELLVHDIDTNIGYFDSVSEHPLLGNTEEIVTADRNMRIMRARLDEYVLRMEELSSRKLRKKTEVRNRPVVR